MKVRYTLAGLVSRRLNVLIPAGVVIAVLGFSMALPRMQLSANPLDFGYGYGPAPQQYHPLQPARIFDTRNGTGGATGKLGQASAVDIQVTGRGGVPANQVISVVLNVTAANGTGISFLSVYPTGAVRPTASTHNWLPGNTDENLVEVLLGTGGKISVYNQAGTVDVIVDVEGYTSIPLATPGVDGLYNPVVPSRVLDTRIGLGAPAAKLGPGATLDLQINGSDGLPASGIEAVALNITAVNSTAAASFVTAWPQGTTRPFVSNVNFTAGMTKPNRAIVGVANGKISLYNQAGSVDLVVDVNGSFTDGTIATAHGSVFVGESPRRLLDTRSGAPLGQNTTINPLVSGVAGVPSSGVQAVVLNVTAVSPTAISFLTIWPGTSGQPFASDLNFVPGQTVPNMVIVKLGSDGTIKIFNKAGNTHVVVDVMGWYAGP